MKAFKDPLPPPQSFFSKEFWTTPNADRGNSDSVIHKIATGVMGLTVFAAAMDVTDQPIYPLDFGMFPYVVLCLIAAGVLTLNASSRYWFPIFITFGVGSVGAIVCVSACYEMVERPITILAMGAALIGFLPGVFLGKVAEWIQLNFFRD